MLRDVLCKIVLLLDVNRKQSYICTYRKQRIVIVQAGTPRYLFLKAMGQQRMM